MRFEVRLKCSDAAGVTDGYSGSSFQTVGAAEEKLRAAVLVHDLGTVGFHRSKSHRRRGTYGSNTVCG